MMAGALTDDELSLVLQHPSLSKRDLLSCMSISRRWKQIATRQFWSQLCLDTAIGGGTVWLPQISTLQADCCNQYELEGDDFDEAIQIEAWNELHRRGRAIAEAIKLFPNLRHISVVIDAKCDDDALDPLSLASILRCLAKAVKDHPFLARMELTLVEGLTDPRYLSPIVAHCAGHLRSITIVDASPWSLANIDGLINAVSSLESLSILRCTAFSEHEVQNLIERHGRHLRNLSDEFLIKFLSKFSRLSQLRLTGSVRLWNRNDSDSYRFTIPNMPLEDVDVEKCTKIPPLFFTSLSNSCRNLSVLRAGETLFTDENFLEILMRCMHLEECYLQHCENVTGKALSLCLEHRPRKLKILNFYGCQHVTNDESVPFVIDNLAAGYNVSLTSLTVGPIHESNKSINEWRQLAASFTADGVFARILNLDLRRGSGCGDVLT
ncbi:hypothetical protein BC829DRAFT_384852, partial [Chytridium lagenaria]